jgi:hypothetical protein
VSGVGHPDVKGRGSEKDRNHEISQLRAWPLIAAGRTLIF